MVENVKQWHKKWWGKLIIICLFFALSFFIAFGIYVWNLAKNMKDTVYQISSLPTSTINAESEKENHNYWFGASKPTITIVEFGDFACSLCKSSFSTIRSIGLEYPRDVKIIFRDYPQFEGSVELALAARCAGAQGLFWPMHDKLFQNQGEIENLVSLAAQIGADTDEFSSCMENETYLPQISEDYVDGQSLEISGTPTFFVNGYKVSGDAPLETWEEIINTLISKL